MRTTPAETSSCLTPGRVQFFHGWGHLVFRGLFDAPEVAELAGSGTTANFVNG